jgi:Hemerythrin HHE cation binding domain
MTTKKSAASAGKAKDAIELLIEDHRRVQKMFKDFEKLDDEEEKTALVEEACTELKIHTMLEEEIFYPAAREALDEADLLNEAEVEHASANDLIEELEDYDGADEMADAKFKVLGKYVNHHIKGEQDELFPKVKKAKLDVKELAEQLMRRKQELQQEMGLASAQGREEAAPRKAARSR